MKRSKVSAADVADWHNLVNAFYKAAKGKRQHPTVKQFAASLNEQLTNLQHCIISSDLQLQPMCSFIIHDPKRRVIHAPSFRDRVLHHALMAMVGPVLDRAMVNDSFACRQGLGSLAAIQRAQHYARRFSWHLGIDFQSYFPTIEHARLKRLLAARFKSKPLLALLAQVIDAGSFQPGRGLPIGALTSQYFANYYLDGLDRLLLAEKRTAGMLRYMDDVVWWTHSKVDASAVLEAVKQFNENELLLVIKPQLKFGQTNHGLLFCGYRIFPGRLLLSRRRQHCYGNGLRRWEQRWQRGEIGAIHLQRAHASLQGAVQHADSLAWRQRRLALRAFATVEGQV